MRQKISSMLQGREKVSPNHLNLKGPKAIDKNDIGEGSYHEKQSSSRRVLRMEKELYLKQLKPYLYLMD